MGPSGYLWDDSAPLGEQQVHSFGVGVKMVHVSLPSLPETPWDPGANPLRADRHIFSLVSSSQAILFFGFASLEPSPGGVS